jgi:hypothetical protein
MTRGLSPRIAGAVLVLALGSFLVSMALAARAYPGGTYCEPQADRYRFWGNFFCDLTRPLTARGEDNARAAAFMQAAFVAFACAVVPFFWLLGRTVGRTRVVGGLGLVSAVATAVLAWLPSSAAPTVHTTAVFSATVPGLGAAALGVYGLCNRTLPPRLRIVTLLGVATFCAGFADAAGFAYAVAVQASCLPWLPALQKVVALFLMAWMLATAGEALAPVK